MILFLYTTIFYILVSHSNGAPQHPIKRQNLTADELLDSLLHLMEFFFHRYKKVNVDGIFGVRMTQNEMIRALAKIDNGEYPTASAEIRSKLENIRDLAGKICEQALPEARKLDEEYYENFIHILEKPWNVFEYKPQRLKKMGEKFLPNRPFAEADDETEFNEDICDSCMQSLIGSDGKKCNVDKCWDIMTKHGTILYYTTHQVLYLQFGHKFGCQLQLEQKATEIGGLEKLYQGLCYNIIYQMETMFQHGKVKAPLQDIFMESGVVCGISGFMDALNITWLKEAMSWQDTKLGCFKEQYDTDAMNFNVGKELFIRDLNLKRNEWRKRNLLFDANMGDSCSSHKSAVAAGYLAVHIRLFFEPEIMKFRLPQHLRPVDLLRNHERYVKYYPFSNFFYICIIFFALCILMVRNCRKLRHFSVFCRR